MPKDLLSVQQIDLFWSASAPEGTLAEPLKHPPSINDTQYDYYILWLLRYSQYSLEVAVPIDLNDFRTYKNVFPGKFFGGKYFKFILLHCTVQY